MKKMFHVLNSKDCPTVVLFFLLVSTFTSSFMTVAIMAAKLALDVERPVNTGHVQLSVVKK